MRPWDMEPLRPPGSTRVQSLRCHLADNFYLHRAPTFSNHYLEPRTQRVGRFAHTGGALGSPNSWRLQINLAPRQPRRFQSFCIP